MPRQHFAAYLWQVSTNCINLSGLRFLRPLVAKAPQLHFLFPFVALLLAATFFGTQKEVTVSVDGSSVVVKTHLNSVGAILDDAGIPVRPGDIVLPPISASLQDSRAIVIRRARPVVVNVDGMSFGFRTQSKSTAEIVQESGLDLRKEDTVSAGNAYSERNTSTPPIQPKSGSIGLPETDDSRIRASGMSSRGGNRDHLRQPGEAEPVEITIERSVPVYIHDGEAQFELYTTRPTIGDALVDNGIAIFEGDLVFPQLGTRTTSKTHVYILRAKPITIDVDGRTIRTRTQAKTVEEAILQEGVKLVGKDRSEPGRSAPVESYLSVTVIRVKEDVITEQESISYATEYRPDPTLEIDERRVSDGKYGLRKWQTRIVYENGEEMSRTIERQWIETPPENKIVHHGTKIVLRELQTPDGTVTYWRKFRMWATSYNASHGGKSRDNPAYGVTRTGIMVTKGIVAIDPSIIPFYTRLYVPGYGAGLAADTGGGIIGMMIDLGFEENDTGSWYSRWTDVYLLTPVPPASQIQYRLFDR